MLITKYRYIKKNLHFLPGSTSNSSHKLCIMYETPPSLKDVCVDFICANVETLIDKGPHECSPLESGMDLVYSNQDMFLPQTISEQLLTTLSKKKKLNDFTMGIFDPQHCKLR